MGAVTCPECGKPYAPHREDCPHCEAENPAIVAERTKAEVEERVRRSRESERTKAEVRARAEAAARKAPPPSPVDATARPGRLIPAIAAVMIVALAIAGFIVVEVLLAWRARKLPMPAAQSPPSPDTPDPTPVPVDPFPFADDARVTAEARELLKANYDQPHGGHVLLSMQSRHPNDPEGAMQAALDYFKPGVRNRWRFAARVVERARDLGMGQEVALEALHSDAPVYGTDTTQTVRLARFMEPDVFNHTPAAEFDRSIVDPEHGELAHYYTTKIIDDALRRAAKRLDDRRRIESAGR